MSQAKTFANRCLKQIENHAVSENTYWLKMFQISDAQCILLNVGDEAS